MCEVCVGCVWGVRCVGCVWGVRCVKYGGRVGTWNIVRSSNNSLDCSAKAQWNNYISNRSYVATK